MDVFSEIKEALPMPSVAEHYGFKINRGQILCPFHGEKTPSLKVYPGDRGWWCFGCNEGGSVIDFVARLFGLSGKDAAAQLDRDFGLGLMGKSFDRGSAERWKREKAAREADRAAQEREYWRCRELYLNNEKAYLRAKERLKVTPPGEKRGVLMGKLDFMSWWLEENALILQNRR